LKQTVRNAIVSGKVRDAEQALVNESARAPSDPEILTLASALFLADDQPLNCAISLKKVEKLRPLSGNEQFSLAMAYIAIKKPAWARAELQKLAVNSPADARYPYWLARISYDEARYEDAEQLLRKAISLDPAAARPYDNLGLNLEALGRLDEALTAYNTARELNRKIDHSPWPALNSGALALKMGKLPEAKAALDEAITLDNNSAQAITELQRATKLDPHYADPWWALSRLLRRRGDTTGASAALAQFQKLKQLN
jgi:Flp pilus assembly protein TadD